MLLGATYAKYGLCDLSSNSGLAPSQSLRTLLAQKGAASTTMNGGSAPSAGPDGPPAKRQRTAGLEPDEVGTVALLKPLFATFGPNIRAHPAAMHDHLGVLQ